MAVAAGIEIDLGIEIEFRGERLCLDPRGVAYWPVERMLIVSDMHLEKGSSFAAKYQRFMPPYDTKATLSLLQQCIDTWSPSRVLSLGDGFHDDNASDRLDDNLQNMLAGMMKNRDWIWLSGNHDPSPPENLGGSHCTSLQLGPLNFTHEPHTTFTDGEISGHLHPKAKIVQRGKAVKRRCFIADDRRMIFPAFGAFTGGLNVHHEAFDGLLNWPEVSAWMLSGENVYEMSGSRLAR